MRPFISCLWYPKKSGEDRGLDLFWLGVAQTCRVSSLWFVPFGAWGKRASAGLMLIALSPCSITYVFKALCSWRQWLGEGTPEPSVWSCVKGTHKFQRRSFLVYGETWHSCNKANRRVSFPISQSPVLADWRVPSTSTQNKKTEDDLGDHLIQPSHDTLTKKKCELFPSDILKVRQGQISPFKSTAQGSHSIPKSSSAGSSRPASPPQAPCVVWGTGNLAALGGN